MMKKIFCAVLLVLLGVSVCTAGTREQAVNAGVLTYLGMTEQEFQQGLDDLRKAFAPFISSVDDDDDMLSEFSVSLVKSRRIVHFYDSLLSMQMALRSGKVSEIALPEAVGMYLITHNPQYDISFSLNMMPSTISFGFRRGDTALQKEFNGAIEAMKKDGTLANLEKLYINNMSMSEPEEIKFQQFKDAPTIRVAVTGDLPPIDFIAADGRPTGYNTALLAQIGRRLRKNIRLISVDAGGRSAALASERADVVFWYRSTEGLKTPKKLRGKNLRIKDNLDGVILSVPYYEWDTDLIIGRAK